MDFLQEISKLDVEIAEQSSVVRLAGNKYILDGVIRAASALVIILGSFISIILLIIGVILLSLTVFNVNESYKNLLSEERKLIELQARRSAMWTEMMSKE